MKNFIELRGWIKSKDTRDYLGYGMCKDFDYIGFPLNKNHECRDSKGNEFGCDELIWMSYIGQKDSKGKKIYEGDIISTAGAYVVYDKELACFCFQFKDSKTPPTPLFHNDKTITVIGNIYENPELLK